MKYENIIPAKFISRPNRFVAIAEKDGEEISVHVKNTGRCRELLVPGAEIYLEDFSSRMGKRKMAYDLIAVKKGNLLINMDSQAPNKVVKEALESGVILPCGMDSLSEIKAEKTYGESRFDFYFKDMSGKEAFMEVKGVTLENEGVASFPDAPTERGIKHLHELCHAKKEGYNAYVLFVIQMEGMKLFVPNDERHAAFGEALRLAESYGVKILVHECKVTPDTIEISKAVKYRL